MNRLVLVRQSRLQLHSLRVILSFEAEHRQRFDRQSLKATRAAFDSAASELLRTSTAKP